MDQSLRNHEILPGEIVIEVTHPKNSPLFFHAVGESVESAVIPQKSGTHAPASFNGIMRIPGQRIHLNPSKAYGRITCGLGDPKNQRVADQVAKAINGDDKFGLKITGPRKLRVFENLTQQDIASWMYWMARAVETKYLDRVGEDADGPIGDMVPGATILQGTLKPADQIAADNRIPVPNGNPVIANKEFKDGIVPSNAAKSNAKQSAS